MTSLSRYLLSIIYYLHPPRLPAGPWLQGYTRIVSRVSRGESGDGADKEPRSCGPPPGWISTGYLLGREQTWGPLGRRGAHRSRRHLQYLVPCSHEESETSLYGLKGLCVRLHLKRLSGMKILVNENLRMTRAWFNFTYYLAVLES